MTPFVPHDNRSPSSLTFDIVNLLCFKLIYLQIQRFTFEILNQIRKAGDSAASQSEAGVWSHTGLLGIRKGESSPVYRAGGGNESVPVIYVARPG